MAAASDHDAARLVFQGASVLTEYGFRLAAVDGVVIEYRTSRSGCER